MILWAYYDGTPVLLFVYLMFLRYLCFFACGSGCSKQAAASSLPRHPGPAAHHLQACAVAFAVLCFLVPV